jgi:lysophospholipase L1-like esterase
VFQNFDQFSILDAQTVWLVGSSLIKHAFSEAKLRPGGPNLTLERENIDLWWQGYSGLLLGKTRQKLKILEKVGPVPNFILLHCGGNDIAKFSVRRIRVVAKELLLFITTKFPNVRIIWSFILPRLQWRYSINTTAMEKVRRRINSYIANLVMGGGGAIIRHTDILSDPAFFLSDGVHLSRLGNNVFLNSIQGGLEAVVLHGHSCHPK